MSDLLSKMDPMVRKLESAMSEFSIQRTSDYLADDVGAIYKSEREGPRPVGPNDIFAGGVPVMQFNSTQGVIAKGERPMGYIGPDRIGAHFKKQGQV